MALFQRRTVKRKMALSRPHCGARGRRGRGPGRGRPASQRPGHARSRSPRAPGEPRAGAARWAGARRARAATAFTEIGPGAGSPGRGPARDAELGRLPQTAPGTRRVHRPRLGPGASRGGPGISACPPSLPCMLLTAGWPEAGGPMGPGVPPPPPEPPPPPPLGLGAAIVGSEERSGAAAAAMQQARPLAPLRARRAPPWPRPGHASATPPCTPPPELTRSLQYRLSCSAQY